MYKNTQALGVKDTETRVIFNPKVCVDVDIEIGSFVRIYEPWSVSIPLLYTLVTKLFWCDISFLNLNRKEMEVKKTKEVIIMCSYFSSL